MWTRGLDGQRGFVGASGATFLADERREEDLVEPVTYGIVERVAGGDQRREEQGKDPMGEVVKAHEHAGYDQIKRHYHSQAGCIVDDIPAHIFAEWGGALHRHGPADGTQT